MKQIVIQTSDELDAEVAEAFGEYWNLRDAKGARRSATPAEVKAYLIDYCLKPVVERYRTDKLAAQTPTTFDAS